MNAEVSTQDVRVRTSHILIFDLDLFCRDLALGNANVFLLAYSDNGDIKFMSIATKIRMFQLLIVHPATTTEWVLMR